MSLFDQKSFDKFTAALPGVTLHDQWESRVAKVGGKVFALLTSDKAGTPAMSFKVEELSFEILTELDGVAQAPYFAKRKWVSAKKGGGLKEADLKAYLTGSHGLVAAGLTKKLRAELGIAE